MTNWQALTDSTRAADGKVEPPKERTNADPSWPTMDDEPGSVGRLNYLLHEAGLAPALIDQWASSPERSWYVGRRFFWKELRGKSSLGIYGWAMVGLVITAIGGLIFTIGTTMNASTLPWQPLTRGWGIVIATAGIVILGWCTVPYWTARRAFSARRRAAAKYGVDSALEDLRRAMETGLSTRIQLALMFQLNRKQLDEYQEITKNQQRTAFILTWIAAVAAFLILIFGSFLSLRLVDQDKQFIAGGLTALGSLLSAFLSAVFFRGHDLATNQLNHYYLEPSLTGRILAVERMLEHLTDPADKSETAKLMMKWIRDLEFPPKTQNGSISGGHNGNNNSKEPNTTAD